MTVPERRAPRLWLAAGVFAAGVLTIIGGLTLDADDVGASRYQPQYAAIVGGPTALLAAAFLLVRAVRVPWFARLSPSGLTLHPCEEIPWHAIDWFHVDGSSLVVRVKPVEGVDRGFRGAPLRRCGWSAGDLGAALERSGARRFSPPPHRRGGH